VSNPAMSFLAALYVINSILAHNVTPELSELDFIWFAHIPHNVSPCAFVLQPCSPIGCLPTGSNLPPFVQHPTGARAVSAPVPRLRL
jgi:hypothetical protein